MHMIKKRCVRPVLAAMPLLRLLAATRTAVERRLRFLIHWATAALVLVACAFPGNAQAAGHLSDYLKQIELPDILPGADRIGSVEGDPPSVAAYSGTRLLGYIYLNSDVVSSTGYSAKPINIVIGIDLSGKITGAKLVEHHEPIVLTGIPPAKITNFIKGYVGLNFQQTPAINTANPPVDIISGATVTTMVIGDSITRSAVRIARSRGLGTAQAALVPAAPTTNKKIDESRSAIENWNTLLGDGSIRRLSLNLGEINDAFAKSANPLAAAHPEEGPASDSFIDLFVALANVPTIGRSLLGEAGYGQLKQRLKPGQQAIIVAGGGRFSFKGSGYVRGGIFDRIELVQGENIIRFRDRDHTRLGDLAAAGAPNFPEIGLFAVPAGENFDPTAAWRLKLLVQRAIEARDKAFLTFDLDYTVPDKYLTTGEPAVIVASPNAAGPSPTPQLAPPQEESVEPLWMRVWRARVVDIAILSLALLVLTAIFFFQDFLVRRPVLYDRVRLGFLAFTLFWIGWHVQAQLSVVNILTFANALRTDFRWDYFLVDPLIFILWFGVVAALLFWGRGAFCGWLCPFGALQELLSRVAKTLRVPQIRVPFGLHQRLWPIKYIIFLVLFGLSLYSLSVGEVAAEVEPFKTAIVLRFMRDWPFVLFAAAVLLPGLFIERFYCRYLCPLGAALAIPGRIRMFDWLRRHRECGNPCQRCAMKCPVQSIHPEGYINPNECIQCMHCQMLYHHDQKCPVMIQRRLKREKRRALTSPCMRPDAPPRPLATTLVTAADPAKP
jgi:NosR/NirI family transcriptional regulator, nitrous oxide reductase regulator